jgi:uncharacterized protein (UPF0305 family)
MSTTGDLGRALADIVLSCSPRNLQEMRWNFSGKIGSLDPEYKRRLEETITGYLHGTHQDIRLMNQQGIFSTMHSPVPSVSRMYWQMVEGQCTGGDPGTRLRFLKFLLSGFCMLVLDKPGHPVGMPFPGGDSVTFLDGTYYCPVREKANDVDAALCPFCPALQTPGIGYLKPPVNGSKRRKQEFIRDCYEYHHFNG